MLQPVDMHSPACMAVHSAQHNAMLQQPMQLLGVYVQLIVGPAQYAASLSAVCVWVMLRMS